MSPRSTSQVPRVFASSTSSSASISEICSFRRSSGVASSFAKSRLRRFFGHQLRFGRKRRDFCGLCRVGSDSLTRAGCYTDPQSHRFFRSTVAPRALVLREGVAPVRDRLLTTIFLAAVLHGMIILGLTFGTAAGSSESAPGLQVLLVSEELPEADRNDDATYLAQRTQLGSGNTMDVVPPRNRPTARAMQGQEGVTDGTSFRDGGQSVGGGEDRVLAT